MLPSNLPLGHLDKGIRNLVININRIPEVFTNTTCEGHIWRDCKAWPTKDGWIHFNVKKGTNSNLISKIKKDFLKGNTIFELEEKMDFPGEDYWRYMMNALYESHDNGNLFDRINLQEQEEYFKRADIRRSQILEGWQNFDKVIISYLQDNFGRNYKKLPFRITKP